MSCPGAETFAAWAAGQVGGSTRDALEDHASGCRLCRGVMLAITGVVASPAASETTLETIGRYEIRGPFRPGLLKGYDAELDRTVAIAVATISDPDERERILADADKVSQIQHRNLARVYDSGAIGDRVYVAFEAVEGLRFNDWIVTVPLPSRSWRRRVVREVGNALNAMHRREIVHRDLRQTNIVIRPSGEAVLQFGLGTSPWVAHELTTGSVPSERSDQFAWWELARSALGQGFPHGGAFKKGLAKNPRLRFPSMDAAVGTLATPWWYYAGTAVFGLFAMLLLVRCVNDMNTPAQHDFDDDTTCRITAREDWDGMRMIVAGRAGMGSRHPEKFLRAIEERVDTTRRLQLQACHTGNSLQTERTCLDATWSHLNGGLAEITAQSDPKLLRAEIDNLLLVPPPEACTQQPVFSNAAALDQTAFALDSKLYRIVGTPTERLTKLRALKPDVDNLKNHEVTWRYHGRIARALHDGGHDDEAVAEQKLAISEAEESGDDVNRAYALVDLLRYEGKKDPAVEATAEAAVQRLHTPAMTAMLHAEEGYTRERQQDWQSAVTKLELAKTEYEAVAISTHADQVSVEEFLASSYAGTGDSKRADETFAHALAMAGERYGTDSLQFARIRAEAANSLVSSEPKRARTELAESTARLEALLGPNDWEVARGYGDLCEADLALATVTTSCDHALELARRIYTKKTRDLVWYLDLDGRMQLVARQDAEAEATLEEAMAIASTDFASPMDFPVTQAFLAIALHRQDKHSARADKLARVARSNLAPLPSAKLVVQALDREMK
ncbi:MAG: protein kinase [Kofleriaceae bacterium]